MSKEISCSCILIKQSKQLFIMCVRVCVFMYKIMYSIHKYN